MINLDIIIGIVLGLPLGILIGYMWRNRISQRRRAKYLAEREQERRAAREKLP
jgi:H+/gluconate symporter-like permease